MTVNVTATYHTQSIKIYTLHTRQTSTFKIYRTYVRIEENRVFIIRQCNGDFSEISISNEFNSSMKSTNKSNEWYLEIGSSFHHSDEKHLAGMVSSVKHKLNDDEAAKAAMATVTTTTTQSGLFVSVTRH